MSQKVVYVRKPVLQPIFDPDPDPSPSIIVTALCIIGVTLAGSVIIKPDLWRNLTMLLKPELIELEEKRQKAWKDTLNAIIIVMGIIAVIIFAYMWWEHSKKAKDRKNMIKRYRSYRNKMLRTFRR